MSKHQYVNRVFAAGIVGASPERLREIFAEVAGVGLKHLNGRAEVLCLAGELVRFVNLFARCRTGIFRAEAVP